MAASMQGFVARSAAMPNKRGAAERSGDFGEIYGAFAPAAAAAQAARCAQCGVPFCQHACPLHNNIPDWLRLAAEGRLEEAYALASATNTFPEICGRICPQDRLCEGSCVIEQSGHGAVTIGAVERFIVDQAFEAGLVTPPKAGPARGKSVGIVGSGPAGLAAAERLVRLGYQVTVYERADRAGGLLIYGIPNFKLDKALVTRRVALLEAAGVDFRLNFAVGRDASLEALRARHDAVLIATGVYQARGLELPGASLPGLHQAMDYLIASNRAGLEGAAPALDAKGKSVVVIGGGDTAMDCVRTAIRQGAAKVTCLYRRDRANMPGSAREVAHAEEEGVEFLWLAAPEAFEGGTRLEMVRAHRIRLGLADASRRQTPQPIEGSAFRLPADLAILALGFEPEDLPRQFGAPHLATTRAGTLAADPLTRMTALPGVFAAGDILRGASLVVWAIRDGREAAAAIDTYLQSHDGAAPVAEALSAALEGAL